MSVTELAPSLPDGIVAAEFNRLVSENFEVQVGETAVIQELPFGLFTEGALIDDPGSRRRAMATSTGHTGNNAEESA